MNEREKAILGLLDRLSDVTFQKDVWLNNKYDDIAFSLGETINLLEDYYFFDDVQNGKIMLKDSTQNKQLLDFVFRLDSYDEPEKINNLLTDENWLTIVSLSRELKQYLFR